MLETLTKPRHGGTLCGGQQGEGMGVIGGDGASDGRTSWSCCPPGRTPALTPAPFIGLLASSDHQVADLGSWTPRPRFKISRATAWIGAVPTPTWPQRSSQSYLGPTCSPCSQESQALKHGHLELSGCRPRGTAPGWREGRTGMQTKGRRDRETPI